MIDLHCYTHMVFILKQDAKANVNSHCKTHIYCLWTSFIYIYVIIIYVIIYVIIWWYRQLVNCDHKLWWNLGRAQCSVGFRMSGGDLWWNKTLHIKILLNWGQAICSWDGLWRYSLHSSFIFIALSILLLLVLNMLQQEYLPHSESQSGSSVMM